MQRPDILLMANPYWQRCKSWYGRRSSRDRKALQLLVAALCVGLIYFLVWEPVIQWSEAKKGDYLYQEEINLWLHSNLSKAREMQKSQQQVSARRELSGIAAGVAQQANITLGRVQSDHQGLSVWVEDVAYQKLLNWLVLLQTRHGVSVRQIRIDKLQEEGRVKSYILLGG